MTIDSIADGIAASSPNRVRAVTTANPELLIVNSRFCVIEILGSNFINLHNLACRNPNTKIDRNRTRVTSARVLKSLKNTCLFRPIAVKRIIANPKSTILPLIF